MPSADADYYNTKTRPTFENSFKIKHDIMSLPKSIGQVMDGPITGRQVVIGHVRPSRVE
jgi:hypothetical protein